MIKWLLSLGLFILPYAPVSAQDVTNILRGIISTISIWEDDYTVANIDIDRLSGNGDSRSLTRTLYGGNSYKVIAEGDNAFNDIDLVVYKKSGSSWIEIGKDVDETNVGIVNINPSVTAQYKFEVKAYKFKPGRSNGFYGLTIMFK